MDYLTSGLGLSLSLFPAIEFFSPYLDCLVGPQWKRVCLFLVGLDVLGVSPSLRGRGWWREGFVRVGLGRDEGGAVIVKAINQ